MADKTADNLPVFKTMDPQGLAEAVAKLNLAGIPFQVANRNEGSFKIPRRKHYIFVKEVDMPDALKALSGIPSETITEDKPEPVSPSQRFMAWIQITPLIIALIFAIIEILRKILE